MAHNNELACTYAALMMADDGVAITSEKILAVTKAAGITVEPFWPGLFAKALEGVDIKELVANIGSGAGAAAAPAAGAADAGAPAEEKKEEKKVESESESDEDMGFGLFD